MTEIGATYLPVSGNYWRRHSLFTEGKMSTVQTHVNTNSGTDLLSPQNSDSTALSSRQPLTHHLLETQHSGSAPQQNRSLALQETGWFSPPHNPRNDAISLSVLPETHSSPLTAVAAQYKHNSSHSHTHHWPRRSLRGLLPVPDKTKTKLSWSQHLVLVLAWGTYHSVATRCLYTFFPASTD